MNKGVIIHRTGMITAVGLGAAQTSASVKAGVAGFKESSVYDSRFEPFVLATLPEDVLPALAEELDDVPGLTSRQRRLLRLLTPVFEEVLRDLAETGMKGEIPLFLATPERHPELADPVSADFLDHLAAQVGTHGIPVDWERSSLVPAGRAGGLMAVDRAIRFLLSGGGEFALAGGVDSFLDLMLLGTLDRDRRIQSSHTMDGFIPGEGAAILLLGRPGASAIPELGKMATLVGVGLGQEPGHRYSEAPYKGDGLAAAFSSLLSDSKVLRRPVPTVFAGLNGENFGGKEWGVAYLRSNKELLPDATVEHPVDCFGDLGAALGPVMSGLAALGIQDGTYEAPALVWCSSDGPERAAALVDGVEG